ncbi:MAG: Bug family tripartite tricarboxylate transporter substrate binding protein [Burkholderiales bacterium]
MSTFIFTKTLLRPFLSLVCAVLLIDAAGAQSYPTKPIRWYVPSAASGAFDNATRALAPVLSIQMGQPLIVENRGGSAGVAGMEQAARAAPDGYTLLTAGGSQMVFNKYFYPKLPYDPTKDFAPITLIADLPIALWVHASVPVRSLKELVSYAKANPGKLNYGSAGVGHVFHLAVELFSQQAGIELTHVPYKGIAPASLEFVAGRIQLLFSASTGPIMSNAKAGKIFPLVGGVAERMRAIPEVPNFVELGYNNMDAPNWIGLLAPAGLPPELVGRWNRETVKALTAPEVAKFYDAQSYVAVSNSPEQFGRQLAKEHATWGPIIKKLGITLE